MSVIAAKGFVASGVHAGIRQSKPDLAIVRSTVPAVGAAMWSRNRVQAACLTVNREHMSLAEPQAVVINSGVANSATGERGKLDALATAAEAGRLLDLDAEQVLVLSTGVIGVPLPMGKLLPGLRVAAEGLSAEGGADAATAIMTTDTKPEAGGRVRRRLRGRRDGQGLRDDPSRSGDDARGRDHRLSARAGEAIEFLRPAVDESFNSISVDGDCSTNDAVILLANGAAGTTRTPATDLAFAACLRKVCRELSEQIVADGEGVTVLAEIAVTGAADDRQAKAIAKRIATSALVKTALFGRDANWGRVLMAAGSAPYNGGYAEVDVDRVTLSYNGSVVLRRGAPLGVEPDVSGATCTIGLDLGIGSGSASYLTSDLSYDYVRINADYRS